MNRTDSNACLYLNLYLYLWSILLWISPLLTIAKESASAPTATSSSKTLWDQTNQNSLTNNNCSIYLAESSIPNAGWGIFAGKDYVPGDRIGYPGMGVPLIGNDQLEWDGFRSHFFA
jgi:hypothetical protein